jgi:hypothetical protein
LKVHKEYSWQAGLLQDVNVNPWVVFEGSRSGLNAAPVQ